MKAWFVPGRKEDGQTVIEYGLVLAGSVLAMVVVLASGADTWMTDIATTVSSEIAERL